VVHLVLVKNLKEIMSKLFMRNVKLMKRLLSIINWYTRGNEIKLS